MWMHFLQKALNGIDRNLVYPLQFNTGLAFLYMYANASLGDTVSSSCKHNEVIKITSNTTVYHKHL